MGEEKMPGWRLFLKYSKYFELWQGTCECSQLENGVPFANGNIQRIQTGIFDRVNVPSNSVGLGTRLERAPSQTLLGTIYVRLRAHHASCIIDYRAEFPNMICF